MTYSCRTEHCNPLSQVSRRRNINQTLNKQHTLTLPHSPTSVRHLVISYKYATTLHKAWLWTMPQYLLRVKCAWVYVEVHAHVKLKLRAMAERSQENSRDNEKRRRKRRNLGYYDIVSNLEIMIHRATTLYHTARRQYRDTLFQSYFTLQCRNQPNDMLSSFKSSCLLFLNRTVFQILSSDL